jgi:hypothetical protein
MIPAQAREIFLYYGTTIVAVILLLFYRRQKKGMRLNLKLTKKPPADSEQGVVQLEADPSRAPVGFSHIQPVGERPLNVVFNYNGHSWDAYEVLGLPAGSSPDKVEQAFHTALNSVNAESRPFLEAAFRAIESQWHSYKASGAN